ncbi:MAG: dethiobiotin synthase [Pseudomonadota bacterium]|nr:dethiobiotin synthase [Pseudomonadota bacterium]
MTNAYFVTGTDTNVGKTVVSAALLYKAGLSGLKTLGLKPVAAGGIIQNGKFVNEDANLLREFASLKKSYDAINPICLEEGIAPHIAAKHENRVINAEVLAKNCHDQIIASDFCIIEGAGGWHVPISDQESMIDLAVAIGFPVILVCGIRLGCINHTLLTLSAIETAGLPIAGWVANQIEQNMPAIDENIETLKTRINAPLIGFIPWQDTISIDAVANYLSISDIKQ